MVHILQKHKILSQSMHVALQTIMVSEFVKLWLDLTTIRVCQSSYRPPNGLDTVLTNQMSWGYTSEQLQRFVPGNCLAYF